MLETADDKRTIRIVGADEIDPAKRHISIDSPLARALLKKTIVTPDRERTFLDSFDFRQYQERMIKTFLSQPR